MNLLMVNDAVATVEAMKAEISWADYGVAQVFTAYNTEGGKAVIENEHIDLLLCDIEMPGENGIALIHWIKENDYDIDSVLLTCHAEFEYAREALALGCFDYLLLPASYETIGSAILNVGNRRRERLANMKLQEYGRSWLSQKQQETEEKSENKKTSKEIVQECIEYILQNLSNEELSIDYLASHFYLHPIYLNRIFKKEKGTTINQFIIQKKMELAAELLKNPANSAVAVAASVGYPNYSYFSTIFKKYHGCTPSQYCAQYGQEE